MKKRAFSFIEIIVSLFIVLIIFIPSLKVNSRQLKISNKISIMNSSINFLISIYKHLRNNPIFFNEDLNLNFTNFENFKNSEFFSDFEKQLIPKDDFILNINIKKLESDFFTSKKEINLITINFSYLEKEFEVSLVKFKRE